MLHLAVKKHHTCRSRTPQIERLITLQMDAVIDGKLRPCGHMRDSLRNQYKRGLNGPSSGIQQYSDQKASSFFLTRRSEGREAPHLLLLMVQLQVVPHPPSWPLRCGFPPLLIIPTSSWEDIFPHCNQKESWFFLAWLCPLSSQRYPEAPWVWRRGTVRGGKGLTVPRDSPSLPHNR